MIRLLVRSAAIFLAVITITVWISLQTESAQAWAKTNIRTALKQETGLDVTIGKVQAFIPFYISIENVQAETSDLSLGSITLVPNWFGFLIGNISFLYVHIQDLDLRNAVHSPLVTTSDIPNVSNTPIHIWSLSAERLYPPKQYCTPLLNDLHDSRDVALYYDLQGSLHLKPEQKQYKTHLTLSATAQDFTIAKCTTTLTIDQNETNILLDLTAQAASPGSVFISLPCDTLFFSSELTGNTEQILNALTDQNPLSKSAISGTWELTAIKKASPSINSAASFSPYFRIGMKGVISVPQNLSLSFDTTELTCHELNPQAKDINEVRKSENYFMTLPLDGNVHMNVQQVPETKEIAFSLSTDSISYNNHEIKPLDFSVQAAPFENGWQGRICLDAKLMHPMRQPLPLQGSCNWSWNVKNEGKLLLSEIDIAVAKYPITGTLELLFFPLQIDGKLVNKTSDLTALMDTFSLNGTGMATLECLFTSQTSQELSQKIDLKGSLQSIMTPQGSLEKASIELHSVGLLPNISADIKATASGIFTKNGQIDFAALTLKHQTDAKTPSIFSLSARGETASGAYTVLTNGSYDAAALTCDTLQITSCGKLLHNKEPITLAYTVASAPRSCVLSPFSLFINDKETFTANCYFEQNTLSCEASLIDFPLEFCSPLTTSAIFGNCSGRLQLFGKYDTPQLHIGLTSSDFSFWPAHGTLFEPQIACLEVDFNNHVCKLDATLQNYRSKTPLTLHATLPIQVRLFPFTYSLPSKSDIQAALTGEFSIESLFGPSNAQDEDIAGALDFSVQLDGTYAAPKFSGQIDIEHGRVKLASLNTTLSSISGAVIFDHDTATLKRFTCKDSFGKPLFINGELSFKNLSNITYFLSGKMEEFSLINRDDAQIVTAADITLSGNVKEAELSGVCTLSSAQLDLTKKVQQDIPKLDITFINTQSDKKTFIKDPFLLHFNIDVSLPKNGRIIGLGLNSEWEGDIKINGKNSDVELTGKLQTIKGTFTIGDKVFKLAKGTVDFKGPLKKAEIAVLAQYQVPAMTAQIILKGPIESPKITLKSTPSMKEKEILSWILFNKSASEISPIQGLQLAQTLLKLRNGSSYDIIDKIKQQFGLDRLDFGAKNTVGPQNNGIQSIDEPTGVATQSAAANEVSFQVGKYISEGVMITLSKDVTNEVNRVGIEAQLTENVIAEANVGDDAETQLSLKWKRRY